MFKQTREGVRSAETLVSAAMLVYRCRHFTPSQDILGVLLSTIVAGGGLAAYQTVTKWRRFRRREREQPRL